MPRREISKPRRTKGVSKGGPTGPPRLTRTMLWWGKTLKLKNLDSLLWSITHLVIKNHLGLGFLSF